MFEVDVDVLFDILINGDSSPRLVICNRADGFKMLFLNLGVFLVLVRSMVKSSSSSFFGTFGKSTVM